MHHHGPCMGYNGFPEPCMDYHEQLWIVHRLSMALDDYHGHSWTLKEYYKQCISSWIMIYHALLFMYIHKSCTGSYAEQDSQTLPCNV